MRNLRLLLNQTLLTDHYGAGFGVYGDTRVHNGARPDDDVSSQFGLVAYYGPGNDFYTGNSNVHVSVLLDFDGPIVGKYSDFARLLAQLLENDTILMIVKKQIETRTRIEI